MPWKPCCLLATAAVLTLSSCGGKANSLDASDAPELAAFRTSGNAVYELIAADAQGENLEVLVGASRGAVTPALFTSISFSPEGESMAFAGGTDEVVGQPGQSTDIYTADADGSNLEKLTDLGDAVNPLWSPDGDRILFTRFRLGSNLRSVAGALFSIAIGGEGLSQITEFQPPRIDTAGSISSDGTGIAFTRTRLGSGHRGLTTENSIHVAAVDGSGSERLTPRAAHPAYSPDGRELAFTSERDENGSLSYGDRTFFAAELYVADADGKHPRRLTRSRNLNEASPSWTPDGSRIAYQRGKGVDNAEAMSIFELNPDGNCNRPILTDRPHGAWYASPAWRPSAATEAIGPIDC